MIRERLKNLVFSIHSIPVAIFVLCALTFGPLIGGLGFYWDDWPVIQVAHLNGDFWEFYAYNRPASAWTQAFFVPFLGTSPLNWHLFAEICWALTAVAFWCLLQELWPDRKRENGVMALLFAVHPVFQLHPISVAFSQQYLTYLPFFISFATMLAAIRKPHWFWPLTFVAVLTTLIHLFTMEYFWGLELLRPVLIFLVLREMPEKGHRLLSVLKIGWPYLAALGVVIIWRLFFVQLENDPNELVLLGAVTENPVSGVLQLAQTILQDVVYVLIVRWYDTLQIAWLNLSDGFGLFAWGMGIVSGASFWVYIGRLERKDEPDSQNAQSLWLGLVAILAGGIAVWLVGRQVTIGLYADRFALPLLVGMVMLTVGLIEWGIRKDVRPMVYAILLGLSVASHLRVQNDYRWDWVNQQRAFWQLYWRAPALAEHTVVFSDGTLFRYTGGYPTTAALNVLYHQHSGSSQSDHTNEMDYWFLELDRGYFRHLPEMITDDFPIKENFRQYTFSSTSRQSLVVYYAPDLGNCLWVIRESDQFNPDLPALTKSAIPLSNLKQILADNPGVLPDADVFGAEPTHTWCYFYQKAELARQQEDWAEIVRLAQASAAQGFSPNNRLEWLPFVEGYAHTGDWERATALSVDALAYSKSTRNLFCPIWRSFEQDGLAAPAGTYRDVYARLGCEEGED